MMGFGHHEVLIKWLIGLNWIAGCTVVKCGSNLVNLFAFSLLSKARFIVGDKDSGNDVS